MAFSNHFCACSSLRSPQKMRAATTKMIGLPSTVLIASRIRALRCVRASRCQTCSAQRTSLLGTSRCALAIIALACAMLPARRSSRTDSRHSSALFGTASRARSSTDRALTVRPLSSSNLEYKSHRATDFDLALEHPELWRCREQLECLEDKVKCCLDIAQHSLVYNTLHPHTICGGLFTSNLQKFARLLLVTALRLKLNSREPNIFVIGVLVKGALENETSTVQLSSPPLLLGQHHPQILTLGACIDGLLQYLPERVSGTVVPLQVCCCHPHRPTVDEHSEGVGVDCLCCLVFASVDTRPCILHPYVFAIVVLVQTPAQSFTDNVLTSDDSAFIFTAFSLGNPFFTLGHGRFLSQNLDTTLDNVDLGSLPKLFL
ncbi:hypothetical protein HG531_007766 [Fusarium graminearum]|nr:hypothetical protein HG531_007766 [Fusarium graminearum]